MDEEIGGAAPAMRITGAASSKESDGAFKFKKLLSHST